MSYTQESIERLEKALKVGGLKFDKLIKKLMKVTPKELNEHFHRLHQEEFSKINCLECARCCSDLGPLLYQSDIDRLAKSIKMPASDFYRKYIEMDEDGDYVFNSKSCPFLNSDKSCSVYENRPKACREYPHTDYNKMQQILDKTLKNAEYCPAIHNILITLKERIL